MNNYSLFNPKWQQSLYSLEASAYYYRTWNDFEMPHLHQHNHIEIMYVQSARCRVTFEKETHLLTKGHFIVIDAGIPHKLEVDAGVNCRMLNIEFGFRPMDKSAVGLPFSTMAIGSTHLSDMLLEPFAYKILSDTDGIVYLLKQLIRTNDEINRSNREESDNHLYIQSLYFQLFVDVSRLIRSQTQFGNTDTSMYIEKALNYIHETYDQPLRVGHIADKLGIHENYLQRLFKNHIGLTITTYIRELRLDKARMLLENTQMSIIEITQLIGLDSRQYFTKIFTDRFALSPRAFRKNYNKTNWINK